jgi:hypothetical protein
MKSQNFRSKNEDINLYELFSHLIDESYRLRSKEDTPMALTDKVKPKNSEKRGKKQLKELKFCNYCKKQGHIDESCWTKYPEKSPNTSKNTQKSDDENPEVLQKLRRNT